MLISHLIIVLEFGVFSIYFYGGFTGFFGIALGIFTHLCLLTSTTSFGVPYLTPFAPFRKGVFKDDLLSSPIWKKEFQPIYLKTKKRRKAPHISRGWISN